MPYLLQDMRNTSVISLLYFDDLNKAESHAIGIMEFIKHLLPSGTWGRGEYNATDNVCLEYLDRNAIGAARVYVRITDTQTIRKCEVCGAIATIETRAGYFCDKPHYAPESE